MLDTFAPLYRPEDVHASNVAGSLECLNAGITTLVDWSHINNTPDHPDAAVQGLQETGIRALYAYGSANTSIEKYWYFSPEAIPGDDVRRIRDTYFSSDSGLLTMGLATRGPGFTQDQVVQSEWGLARELGIPITVHVNMGRLAGRYAMVEQLDRLGLLGPDTTFIHCCYFSEHEWQRVKDTGGTISVAPQVELQMGHGWPPLNKARQFGLRPSLSIDVVTTVPGDMFTQIRAAFGAERARVNAVTWELGTPTPETMLTARDMLTMATLDGAHVAGLEDRTGSLTPGQAGRRGRHRRHGDRRRAGARPGGRRHPVRRRLQRRARDRRWGVPQARLPAGRRRQGSRVTGPGVARLPHGGGCQGGQGEGAGCVSTHHLVRRGVSPQWAPAAHLAGARGYAAWSVVDARTPAVHTGFGLGRIDAGGSLPAHVHSYEESLYVLEGHVVVQTAGEAVRLGPGDYGLIPVGVAHSARNDGHVEAVFARMSAPTPRPEHDYDTLVLADLPDADLPDTSPVAADVRDPRVRRYGHIDQSGLDPSLQTQDRLAVSASMRTALLVYSGIAVRMMVDTDLGATLSTMFMVQYQPDGVAGAHDHPFEETYLIVEGSVEATFDGKPTGSRSVTSPGPASAACTASATWGGARCAGSRPRRRSHPAATPTGSRGTGTTCGRRSSPEGRHEDCGCGRHGGPRARGRAPPGRAGRRRGPHRARGRPHAGGGRVHRQVRTRHTP